MNESEILEPLHRLLRELLEREKQGKGDSVEFTDDDVVAVTLLYSHILGKRLVEIMKEEKVGISMTQELAQHYSVLINETTLAMSKVDTSRYYKGRADK